MVDVSDKAATTRVALAEARVRLSEELLSRIEAQTIAKGDLLATARIAGIQAAKRCSDLIPLCHPLPLNKVTVDIQVHKQPSFIGLRIITECKTQGVTGVEMEALTAASIAALTVYDMCKSYDKGIVIEQVRLLNKSGGKSGEWAATNDGSAA